MHQTFLVGRIDVKDQQVALLCEDETSAFLVRFPEELQNWMSWGCFCPFALQALTRSGGDEADRFVCTCGCALCMSGTQV